MYIISGEGFEYDGEIMYRIVEIPDYAWIGEDDFELAQNLQPETSPADKEELKAPIASDGGSSSYYDKEIPQWLLNRLIERNDEGKCFVKTEELIEVLFRNDFSFGNAFKALVRADGVVTGQGKAGNTLSYETTKVRYYADRILEQGENK